MTLIFKTLLAAHLFSDFYIQIQNNNEKKNFLIKKLIYLSDYISIYMYKYFFKNKLYQYNYFLANPFTN